jgi:hypothetical protein
MLPPYFAGVIRTAPSADTGGMEMRKPAPGTTLALVSLWLVTSLPALAAPGDLITSFSGTVYRFALNPSNAPGSS